MKFTDPDHRGRAANCFAISSKGNFHIIKTEPRDSERSLANCFSIATKGPFCIKTEPTDHFPDSYTRSELSLNNSKSQANSFGPVYLKTSSGYNRVSSSDSCGAKNFVASNQTTHKAKRSNIENRSSGLLDYFGACSSKRRRGGRMVNGQRGSVLASHMGPRCNKFMAMSGINNAHVAMALENKIRELKYRVEEQEKMVMDSALRRQGSCEESKTSTEDDDDEMNQTDEDDEELIDEECEEDEDLSFDEEDGRTNGEMQCPPVFQQLVCDKNREEKDGNKNNCCIANSHSPCTSQASNKPDSFGMKLMTCQDCDKVFTSRLDLNRHRLVHIEEKSFKCSHCEKSFAFSFNLRSHERVHSGEKPYICEECGEAYMHAVDLRTHQETHGNQSRHVCSVCTKTFSLKSKYLAHVRRHNSSKPFKCNMCGKAFHRSASLRAHELLHSVDTKEICFPCRSCDRTFMRRAHLQMHEQVHLNEKTFCCSSCGNVFTDESQLKTHLCVRSNVQKYCCDICKQVFSSSTALSSHTKTHMVPNLKHVNKKHAAPTKPVVLNGKIVPQSGKKPFPCKLCNQAFARRKNLVEHELIHKREYTPYMCPECFLTFTHSNYLKLHLQMHKTQKSFQCKLCLQKFPTEEDLVAHGKAHHKPSLLTKMFSCDMCDNKYETESDLQAHRHIHQVLQAGASCQNSSSPKTAI